MNGVRLIIVDDDASIRKTLFTLATDLGAEVVAEADNGRSAIEQATLHRPEIMLLDISMPIMGGFQATRYIRDHLPEIHVILVSQYSQSVYVEEAIAIGVRGYVVKAAVANELERAIKTVLGGETFVSSRINT